MNVQTIEDMLGQVFRNQERLTRRELQQRIAQLHPSPRIENLAQALPDGAYDRYQAGAVLTQIQEEQPGPGPEGRIGPH